MTSTWGRPAGAGEGAGEGAGVAPGLTGCLVRMALWMAADAVRTKRRGPMTER